MRTKNSNTNRKCRLSAIALALGLLVIAQAALAQSSRIDSGTVSPRENKFGFYWETRLDPPTPPLSDIFSTARADGPNLIHRILLDRSQQIYVGYDIIIKELAEPNRYQVTFQKLTTTTEILKQILGANPAAFRPMATPGWGLPAPQEIRGGEVLQLDLLINAVTRQRVTDYVTVQEASHRFSGFNPVLDREFTYVPGPTRDFRLQDVELTLQAPRLSINGKLDESSAKRFDAVSGGVVWIYTARRGRFILSLAPHPELGFRRAGEVRGSSLSFVMGSETFTLSTGRSIAPGQAPFNLYVLHEPDWKPTYPMADLAAFNMGAADQADSLVRK
jgi:hypothetical protein